MLIRLYRSTGFFPPVLLVFLTAAVWIVSKSISYNVVPANGMPLYDLVVTILSLAPEWVGPVLGGLLLASQAIHWNLVLNSNEVQYKQSWLPALMYLILASILPPFLWMHPLLFVNSMLILLLDRIFRLYKNKSTASLIFDAGFILSLASLFYRPVIYLFVFFFLALMILRPFSWREWMIGIMGLFLPIFFTYVYYLLTDQSGIFFSRWSFSSIRPAVELPVGLGIQPYLPGLGILCLLFLVSVVRVQSNYYRNVTKTRLIQQLLLLMIPILFIITLINTDAGLYRYSLLALPLSVFLSYYFLIGKKVWMMELTLVLLLAVWAYHYFIIR